MWSGILLLLRSITNFTHHIAGRAGLQVETLNITNGQVSLGAKDRAELSPFRRGKHIRGFLEVNQKSKRVSPFVLLNR